MHRSNTYFDQIFFGLIYDLRPWIPDEVTLNLYVQINIRDL